MGLSRHETQITWSAAESITLSNATLTWSDPITFDQTDFSCGLVVRPDNQSTPSTGDTVEIWIAYTVGDVVGDGGDDYSTDEYSYYYGTIDSYAANTPGEDPAARPWSLNATDFKGFKLGVKAPQGASHSIVVRARIQTMRAA